MQFLIERQTAAVTKVYTVTQYNLNTSIQVDGTLGAYVITIEQLNDETWEQVLVDGEGVQLDADNTVLTFYGTGRYRINKPSTGANEVGVKVI